MRSCVACVCMHRSGTHEQQVGWRVNLGSLCRFLIVNWHFNYGFCYVSKLCEQKQAHSVNLQGQQTKTCANEGKTQENCENIPSCHCPKLVKAWILSVYAIANIINSEEHFVLKVLWMRDLGSAGSAVTVDENQTDYACLPTTALFKKIGLYPSHLIVSCTSGKVWQWHEEGTYWDWLYEQIRLFQKRIE